jgi:hypothetical protein
MWAVSVSYLVPMAGGTLLTELNYYDIEVVIPESETLWARFWGQA